MIDQRRHNRQGLSETVVFRDTLGNTYEGKARDISLGGMFIETTSTLPFGSPLEVSLTVTGGGLKDSLLVLPAVSRWSNPIGMGVQFGLYGAKETHILTELTRRVSMAPSSI